MNKKTDTSAYTKGYTRRYLTLLPPSLHSEVTGMMPGGSKPIETSSGYILSTSAMT